MKYDNVTVKYNSIIGRMNILKRPKGNTFSAKVLGETIYFTCTKDHLLARDFLSGSFKHSDFMTHELAHIDQVRRLGTFKFYTNYIYQYIRNLLKGQSSYDAYLNISFEIEAREAERRDITSDELFPFVKGK